MNNANKFKWQITLDWIARENDGFSGDPSHNHFPKISQL